MQDGYGAEDANGAVETMEPQLLSNLLSLLECGRVDGPRLAADYGIVGMDYLPVDTRLEEGKSIFAVDSLWMIRYDTDSLLYELLFLHFSVPCHCDILPTLLCIQWLYVPAPGGRCKRRDCLLGDKEGYS